MTDREAIERLAKAVDLLAVCIATELRGTIGTYPGAPILIVIEEVQALRFELDKE